MHFERVIHIRRTAQALNGELPEEDRRCQRDLRLRCVVLRHRQPGGTLRILRLRQPRKRLQGRFSFSL